MHEAQTPARQTKVTGINQIDFEGMKDSASFQSQGGRRRRLWIIVGLLGVVILLGGGFWVFRSNSAPPVTYQTENVSLGSLTLTIEESGQIQADTYNADFSAQGTISEVEVKLGQTVQKGQVLARLDPASLSGSGSTNTVLRAPHTGVVTAINGSVGESSTRINNGTPATVNFIQITDLSTTRLLLNVSEADMEHVAVGNEVDFTVNAYGDRPFRGTVSTIVKIQHMINNVNTFPVLVSIDPSWSQGATLLPGMSADANIRVVHHSGLTLSANAIGFAHHALTLGLVTSAQVQTAMAAAQQLYSDYIAGTNVDVWQNDPSPGYVVGYTNNQWSVKPVLLGTSNGTDYEVLSGLSANDVVVVGQQGGSAASSTPAASGGNKGGVSK